MKIALIVPGGVDRTGEYRVIPALLALIERLSTRHELHVFALRQERLPATWELLGARIHNVGFGNTRFRAVRTVLAEHRRGPFDVVHAVWSGMSGFVAVLAGKLIGRPRLVHIAGGELVSFPEIGFGGRCKWRGRVQERFVLHGATALSAASQPIVTLIRQLGLDAQRVPLGVDLRAWPPTEPRPRNLSQPARLIHVASLNKVKDQTTLLRAMALLASSQVDFELDVVGEDTLDGETQALTHELGLENRVRFRGFLTQRQLLPVIRAADVLVMSSRHEAGPFVLLEAAAQGVPTVGTAVGHIAEWAPAATVAVPVGDAAALAQAVRELLQSEELRLRIAREAQRRALQEDADHTAVRFEALYELLTEPRRHALRSC